MRSIVLAAHLLRPSFAKPFPKTSTKIRFQRVIPKSALAVFGQDHAQKTGKRSAERRISNHVRTDRQVCETHLCAAARRFPFLRHAAFRRSRLRHSPPATT